MTVLKFTSREARHQTTSYLTLQFIIENFNPGDKFTSVLIAKEINRDIGGVSGFLNSLRKQNEMIRPLYKTWRIIVYELVADRQTLLSASVLEVCDDRNNSYPKKRTQHQHLMLPKFAPSPPTPSEALSSRLRRARRAYKPDEAIPIALATPEPPSAPPQPTPVVESLSSRLLAMAIEVEAMELKIRKRKDG